MKLERIRQSYNPKLDESEEPKTQSPRESVGDIGTIQKSTQLETEEEKKKTDDTKKASVVDLKERLARLKQGAS